MFHAFAPDHISWETSNKEGRNCCLRLVVSLVLPASVSFSSVGDKPVCHIIYIFLRKRCVHIAIQALPYA